MVVKLGKGPKCRLTRWVTYGSLAILGVGIMTTPLVSTFAKPTVVYAEDSSSSSSSSSSGSDCQVRQVRQVHRRVRAKRRSLQAEVSVGLTKSQGRCPTLLTS